MNCDANVRAERVATGEAACPWKGRFSMPALEGPSGVAGGALPERAARRQRAQKHGAAYLWADSNLEGSASPVRSSSHAIALIFHPPGVLMNCVLIIPRPLNGVPFNVPDFE